MKKTAKRILLAAVAIMLCFVMAYAETPATTTDRVGNYFTTESGASNQSVECDAYVVGSAVEIANSTVGQSALLAGKDININNTTINGSLRAAGYSITADATAVKLNATVAGYSVSLGSGFSAGAVYAAGNKVQFNGACEELHASAGTVVINGTVEGDVHVQAENITVGSNAVIKGVLRAESGKAPVIADGAQVGSVAFQQTVAESSEEEHAAATTSPFVNSLKGLLMMLPGRVLIAVLLYFVLRSSTRDAANMITSRPVAMPITGLVSLIVIPIAVVLLMITYIGVPVGALLLCLYILALVFSVSFAGCAAGQCVFPGMHPLVASIIGVAVLSVVKIIPFVGWIVTLGSMLYTLGYFVQKCYLNLPKKKANPAPAPEQE